MNKKTLVFASLAGYFLGEALYLSYRNRQLVKEYNSLVRTYNVQLEANNYFFNIARSALRKVPVEKIPEMRTDIEFYHIAAKERGL